jgi:hypothetical protein
MGLSPVPLARRRQLSDEASSRDRWRVIRDWALWVRACRIHSSGIHATVVGVLPLSLLSLERQSRPAWQVAELSLRGIASCRADARWSRGRAACAGLRGRLSGPFRCLIQEPAAPAFGTIPPEASETALGRLDGPTAQEGNLQTRGRPSPLPRSDLCLRQPCLRPRAAPPPPAHPAK